MKRPLREPSGSLFVFLWVLRTHCSPLLLLLFRISLVPFAAHAACCTFVSFFIFALRFFFPAHPPVLGITLVPSAAQAAAVLLFFLSRCAFFPPHPPVWHHASPVCCAGCCSAAFFSFPLRFFSPSSSCLASR